VHCLRQAVSRYRIVSTHCVTTIVLFSFKQIRKYKDTFLYLLRKCIEELRIKGIKKA